MKVSFNWLKELVALPAGTAARVVAERLSLSGLEVESIEPRGREVAGVRIAEVLGARPHPSAEKLRIVRVTVGDGVEHEVVCGAPNVPDRGGRVAWAPPGATLPGGITLGRKEVRGVESPGMLCSERELGLGEDADGIVILSSDVGPVGADLVTALGLVDDIFEVNVTPNRSDALSHAGIAREVAALFGTTWRLPQTPSPETSAGIETPFPVQIQDPEACARYQATVVRGLRVQPSPLWMRLRLRACGVRAISNLVDVTNYVMLETGHPLHAFDLTKLSAPIVVRRAHADERLSTLDGVERALEPGDIVIADKHGAVALAGVMGGATSEVSETTTDVLLEAATFDPRSIRRTSKRLGLHSEASHRFERGVDPSSVAQAGARAAALLAELGGGAVAPTYTDVFSRPVTVRRVTLSLRKLSRVAGFDIPVAEVITTLSGLGIAASMSADGLVATVPSYRPDITIEEDLIEEVMRLLGFDRVPARLTGGGKAPARHPERAADRARDTLAALGLHEIVTWAFVPRGALSSLGRPSLAIGISVKNPISADYEVMRTSLLPGLADATRRNLSRGATTDVRLFEVGPVIFPAPEDPERHHEQKAVVAGMLLGTRGGWLKPGDAIDFFDLKSVVTELLRRLGIADERVSFRPGGAVSARRGGDDLDAGVGEGEGEGKGEGEGEGDDGDGDELGFLHPGISARVELAEAPDRPIPESNPGPGAPGRPVKGSDAGAAARAPRSVGVLGQLHPRTARRIGIDAPAFYFELDLDVLEGETAAIRAQGLPRFPAATRDISFWVDAAVTAADQERSMRALAEPLLRDIGVLEDFRDPRFVAPGKKGMLWTLTYRSDDRTLTDAEVDAAHARIVAGLSRAHAIQIR